MVVFELPALLLTFGSVAIYKSLKTLYDVTLSKYTTYKVEKIYNDISPICEHNTFDQVQCVICFEDLKTNFRQLPCEHVFHKQCIDTWILDQKGNCPICNHVVI
jgi:hypothetical protein